MSYTYPQALTAFEAIANDYIKVLRPQDTARVHIFCDANAQTASVTWDVYGVRVRMPVRAAASIMTQEEFEDWVSYLLHELGHPTFTDQAAWQEAIRAGVSRMVNATEDVRMEWALIASGIVPNAKAVLSRLIARKVAIARSTGWRPNSRSEFGWTLCVLGRAANGYAIHPDDLAWIKSSIKTTGTVAAVMAWALPDLAACKSTADCVELSKRIMAALAKPQTGQGPDINGNPNPNTPEGDGKGTEGDDEGEASKGEGEGKTSGEGSKGEGEGETPEGEGVKGGKGGKGHGDGKTDDEMPVASDDDLAKHELSPEGEALKGRDAQNEKTVVDILRDSVMRSGPEGGNTSKTNIAGDRLREAAARASKQRALLARALRASEIDEREGGRRSGRLDRSALARVAAGATNVFERRETSEGFDTDVSVLLDASGSMAGANMFSAMEVGLIVSQAAASVGACCTVEIFNSRGFWRAGTLAGRRTPNPFEFGGMVRNAGGGTPLSAHMARAAVAQAKRASQKRRVLFVITDGACDYGPGTVAHMAKYLEKTHGTVLAHVSIGTPLTGAFKAEVMVPVGVPLAEVGLGHFVKVLQAL
jgi:hypothetical protein